MKEVRCSLSNFTKECYIEGATKAIPKVVEGKQFIMLPNFRINFHSIFLGIPEFNIPRLDPYYIPFLKAIDNPQLSINFTNSKILGLKDLKPVKIE